MTTDSQLLFSTSDTRCLRQGAALVLSFTQPRPTISADVLGALERAVNEAERSFATLVVSASGEHFAWGANLDAEFAAAINGHPEVLDAALVNYQRVMLRLRHASVPTIASIRGVAISGGCELLMHCTAVVVHAESRIGLLEPLVGIVPGGGGLKEFALRASRSPDPEQQIIKAFESLITLTWVSPQQAQQIGYLTQCDQITAADPLPSAIELGLNLHAAGHKSYELNPAIRPVGAKTLQVLRASQRALLQDGKITAHQFDVNMRMALVLCGGDSGESMRNEEQLFAFERQHLIALLLTSQTQERIEHMRRTGRPSMN
jgi:3-hydroxyacyl-CoA dehydrogenase